jgi:uncharacterized cupredoxin-like copper-binding protein
MSLRDRIVRANRILGRGERTEPNRPHGYRSDEPTHGVLPRAEQYADCGGRALAMQHSLLCSAGLGRLRAQTSDEGSSIDMTKIRIVTFGVVAAIATLAWALPAVAHPVAAKGSTVNVVAGKPSEFQFMLSTKTVKHGTVTFKVTNKGALPHSFEVCSSSKGGTANACTGKATATISPGGAATLTVAFKTVGTYEYLCTVSGHAAAGQKGDIKVT